MWIKSISCLPAHTLYLLSSLSPVSFPLSLSGCCQLILSLPLAEDRASRKRKREKKTIWRHLFPIKKGGREWRGNLPPPPSSLPPPPPPPHLLPQQRVWETGDGRQTSARVLRLSLAGTLYKIQVGAAHSPTQRLRRQGTTHTADSLLPSLLPCLPACLAPSITVALLSPIWGSQRSAFTIRTGFLICES